VAIPVRSPPLALATSARRAMSGRISSLAGYTEASRRSRLFRRRGRAAGCGIRRLRQRFQTVFDDSRCSRSERSRSIPPIRKNVWVDASGESWTRTRLGLDRRCVYKSTDAAILTHSAFPTPAHFKIIVDPALGLHRLCLRARQAVTTRPSAVCTRPPTAGAPGR